ncbi:collagen alpha-1(I) chain-like [Penaeus vannamei]|uniref:collagen alpha-1(I) chain-like n=1 Tax=Penaeus vannamei TaxID=6689 RepID=UPI00387F8686
MCAACPLREPAAEGFCLIKALLPRGRRLQRHVLALELPQLSKYCGPQPHTTAPRARPRPSGRPGQRPVGGAAGPRPNPTPPPSAREGARGRWGEARANPCSKEDEAGRPGQARARRPRPERARGGRRGREKPKPSPGQPRKTWLNGLAGQAARPLARSGQAAARGKGPCGRRAAAATQQAKGGARLRRPSLPAPPGSPLRHPRTPHPTASPYSWRRRPAGNTTRDRAFHPSGRSGSLAGAWGGPPARPPTPLTRSGQAAARGKGPIIRFTGWNSFDASASYPEGNFGGNQLLDSWIGLSPLYSALAIDLHVRNASDLHQGFPAGPEQKSIYERFNRNNFNIRYHCRRLTYNRELIRQTPAGRGADPTRVTGGVVRSAKVILIYQDVCGLPLAGTGCRGFLSNKSAPPSRSETTKACISSRITTVIQGPLLRHAQGEDALRTPHHPRPGKRLTFSWVEGGEQRAPGRQPRCTASCPRPPRSPAGPEGGLLGPALDPRGTRARLAAFQPSPARSAGGGDGSRRGRGFLTAAEARPRPPPPPPPPALEGAGGRRAQAARPGGEAQPAGGPRTARARPPPGPDGELDAGLAARPPAAEGGPPYSCRRRPSAITTAPRARPRPPAREKRPLRLAAQPVRQHDQRQGLPSDRQEREPGGC